MKVTYIGAVESVGFDGHTFPQGEPVEYSGQRLHKLRANPFFEVDEPEQPEQAPESAPAEEPAQPESAPDFDAMSKAQLEAYGRQHLNIELDRRKKKDDLVSEIKAAYANG